jgi:hypothetical protein
LKRKERKKKKMKTKTALALEMVNDVVKEDRKILSKIQKRKMKQKTRCHVDYQHNISMDNRIAHVEFCISYNILIYFYTLNF